MVSKKILGVAIAAAFSSQAFATVDLNAATGAVVYAKESVTNAQVASGLVQVTGGALGAQVKIGFGVSAGAHAFIRFDLTNGKFKNAVVPGDLADATTAGNVPAANVVVAQGGAAGDAYVIFDVTATASGIPQADVLTLALAGLQLSPTSATTLKFAHYSTSPDAVNQTNALASASAQEASVANALTTTISATSLTADVGNGSGTPFTTFVAPASAGPAVIGNVKFALAAGSLDATGAPVNTLAQVITPASSSYSVTGDLSFTTSTTAALTAADLTFGGVASDTAATNVPSAKLSTLAGQVLAGAGNDVAITAKSAINAGSYSLTVNLAGIANAAYAPATVSGAIGSISRNGATVQVPYLTTNTGLNQKVVLVNRGSSDTTYSVSFTTEGTVTAVAGTAATGTLKAKSTTVLKATDLVTLTGGSRTAATVTVLAPNSTIDAATQTVVTDPASVSFGSSDTVALDVK